MLCSKLVLSACPVNHKHNGCAAKSPPTISWPAQDPHQNLLHVQCLFTPPFACTGGEGSLGEEQLHPQPKAWGSLHKAKLPGDFLPLCSLLWFLLEEGMGIQAHHLLNSRLLKKRFELTVQGKVGFITYSASHFREACIVRQSELFDNIIIMIIP